jgi:hypothetical protein
VREIINAMHNDIAIAHWKAAEAILRDAGWNTEVALAMTRAAIGKGIDKATAEHLEYLIIQVNEEDDTENFDPDESLGPVVNPDGTPTATTIAMLTGVTVITADGTTTGDLMSDDSIRVPSRLTPLLPDLNARPRRA